MSSCAPSWQNVFLDTHIVAGTDTTEARVVEITAVTISDLHRTTIIESIQDNDIEKRLSVISVFTMCVCVCVFSPAAGVILSQEGFMRIFENSSYLTTLC